MFSGARRSVEQRVLGSSRAERITNFEIVLVFEGLAPSLYRLW